MKKILFFYTFFAAITLFAQNVSLDLTASSGTYTVPQGVTSITVEAWGGGGGGGGASGLSFRLRQRGLGRFEVLTGGDLSVEQPLLARQNLTCGGQSRLGG